LHEKFFLLLPLSSSAIWSYKTPPLGGAVFWMTGQAKSNAVAAQATGLLNFKLISSDTYAKKV